MSGSTREVFVKNIVQMTLDILAILVNLCLLLVFWRNPLKRFRNTPSYIIANLALADIVAAIGDLGFSISIHATSKDLKTYWLLGMIATAGHQMSFLLVASLAFDRYFAISHPYRYKVMFCHRKLGVILNVATWVLAWVAVPLLYIYKRDHLVILKLYVGNHGILTLVTIILYPLNYIHFKKACTKLCASSSEMRQKSVEDLLLAQQLNQTWMIVSSFLIVVISPYVYLLAITQSNCVKCIFDPNFIIFWRYYRVVFPVALLVNPFIYAWRLPLYRKSFQNLIVALFSKLHLPCLTGSKNESIEHVTDNLLSSTTQNRIQQPPVVNNTTV